MGKDKEGRFHASKGRPSAAGKKKGLTEPATGKKLKQEIELEEKYAIDADTENSAAVPVQHPNRNADKKAERTQPRSVQKIKNAKPGASSGNEQRGNREKTDDFSPLSLSVDALRELDAKTGYTCISIYFRGSASDTEYNNLIREVSHQMEAKGNEHASITQSLKNFFLHEDQGTRISGSGAVFIADSFYRYVSLPAPPQQMAVVQNSFLIGPLVPFFSNDYFYLLVISKKRSTLFYGDNFSMRPVPIQEMPNGVEDVVHVEEKEDQAEAREKRSGEKENLSKYLSEVDQTIWQAALHNENVPLVLGGVEYLVSIYKKVTQYSHVWDQALTGSLEYEDEKQFYQAARAAVDTYFQEKAKKALAEYGDKSATALTTSLAEHLIPAAYFGRIKQLLVQPGATLWGIFDETSGTVVLHEKREDQDDDLVDKVIAKTLLNSGEVFYIDGDSMPFENQLAAILRY